MKYIDADKLIAEIERLEHENCMNGGEHFCMRRAICLGNLRNIASPIYHEQQEQPDFPTTDEQVKEFLAAHPKIKVPEKYKNPDWLFEKQEQPSSSDLDEAAEKVEDYYDVGDEHGYLYCYRGDIKDAFIAGAKWQYQKDRGEFAKIKAKTWCEGFDAAISRFVKIPYTGERWFSTTDGEFIAGALFEEPIPADAKIYYRKEDKK